MTLEFKEHFCTVFFQVEDGVLSAVIMKLTQSLISANI